MSKGNWIVASAFATLLTVQIIFTGLTIFLDHSRPHCYEDAYLWMNECHAFDGGTTPPLK